MAAAGLSQAETARRIGVSKEAVSNWCRGESQPRPGVLLKLALALGVDRTELLAGTAAPLPRVLFRLKARRKPDDEYREQMRQSARYLAQLVPFLPERMCRNSFIRNPQSDYASIQREAAAFRECLELAPSDMTVDLPPLVAYVERAGAIIIPVPWGDKRHPANGLHVMLEQPQMHWLYLNTDTPVVDAKFWLLHEIAHMLTPAMDPEAEDAESYADAFAGAVLVPATVAAHVYQRLTALPSDAYRIEHLKRLGRTLVVSPLTLYLEANRYARHNGLPLLSLEQGIYGAMTNVAKTTPRLPELLFTTVPPAPAEYIERCSAVFRTPFFRALAAFIKKENKGSGIVARLLHVSGAEVMDIYGALRNHGSAESPA